jgi:hypothetical protein
MSEMTNPVATFRRNKWKAWSFFVAMAVLSLGCLALSTNVFPNKQLDGSARAIIFVGFPLFGFLAFVWSKQLFDSGIILEVSTDGIRDRRYSDAVIPWSVVEKIRLHETSYYEFVAFEFPNSAKAEMPRVWYLKVFDVLNPMLGYDGIQVNMTGLNGTTADLISAVKAAAPPHLHNFA